MAWWGVRGAGAAEPQHALEGERVDDDAADQCAEADGQVEHRHPQRGSCFHRLRGGLDHPRLEAHGHTAAGQTPDDQQDDAVGRGLAHQQEERHRDREGHGDDQHAPVRPGGERRAGDEVADHAGHTEPEQQRTDVALVDPRQLLQCRAHERVGGEVPEYDEHRRDDADAHTRIAGLLTAPVGCPTTMSAW
jgi:hypothetical protein